MQSESFAVSGRVAFRYPNFRYYMAARLLVVTSSEMQALAVAWQVYNLTHRPLDLGLVGLAQFLPGILLFLVAGHVADRVSRRRILQTCYASFALCSTLLLATSIHGLHSVWPVYLILLLNGAVRAFHGPASQALLPLLVAEAHYPNALAWSVSVFQTATIVGPMIGGVLYGWLDSPVPIYMASGVAGLAGLALVSAVRLERPQRRRAVESLGEVLDGLRYIRSHPVILGSISLDLFAVLLGGAVALLPVYAREILRVGSLGLGMLRSAPGIGAVTMAVVLAHWPLRRRAGAAMLWSVVGFGVATIVFGFSRSLPLALAALALTGAGDMISVMVRHTMIQLGTPDAMRGRVSAVNMVFIGASNEVGQFESGLTAQWFGAVPAVILGGAASIAVVALCAWRFPELRRADAPTPAA